MKTIKTLFAIVVLSTFFIACEADAINEEVGVDTENSLIGEDAEEEIVPGKDSGEDAEEEVDPSKVSGEDAEEEVDPSKISGEDAEEEVHPS